MQDQSFACGIDGERGDGERKLKGFFAGAIVESAPALGNCVFVALPSIEHNRQRGGFQCLGVVLDEAAEEPPLLHLVKDDAKGGCRIFLEDEVDGVGDFPHIGRLG